MPFQCSQCGQSATAHVFTTGSAQTAIEHHRVGELAQAAAQTNAHQIASEAPCPFCGGESVVFGARTQQWEKRRRSRRTLRTALGAIGGLMVVSTTVGCGSLYTQLDGHALQGMAMWAVFWSLPLVALLLLLGPGKRPTRRPIHPDHIRFAQ